MFIAVFYKYSNFIFYFFIVNYLLSIIISYITFVYTYKTAN